MRDFFVFLNHVYGTFLSAMSIDKTLNLLLSKSALTEARSTSITEDTNHVDWHVLYERAMGTHLAPILHKSLMGFDFDKEIKKGLENAYNQVLAENILYQLGFTQLGTVLNKHKIALVPLKGIYLGELVYKDIGLRHLSDIDVLVKHEDLEEVCRLMQLEGWKVESVTRHSNVEDTHFFDAHPKTLVKNAVKIELHTHLYNGSKEMFLSKEALWNDTHTERFLGVEIHQFSKEMVLQHLCLHLHKHFFGDELKMLSFCDIREFIRANENEIDWACFEQLASTYGYGEEVRQILYLTFRFWGVIQVPQNLRNPQLPTEELDERFMQLFSGAKEEGSVHVKRKLEARLENIDQLDSWKEKLIYTLGFVFPKKDFMRKNYNLDDKSWLFPWYLCRPIELSAKAFRVILRTSKKRK
ncbi:MAG: hypothetical protein ACI9P8_000933 [Bacteroidia bacterium]|jgi:hypothetical protein